MTELADYPVVVEIPVLWGNMDAYGHVNNVVFFRWFESARIEYGMRVGIDRMGGELGPILASTRCDFRRQVTWPDTIRAAARVTRIGNTSFTMGYAVYSDAQQALAAEGEGTVVILDFATGTPQPVPEDVWKRIEEIEGGDGEMGRQRSGSKSEKQTE